MQAAHDFFTQMKFAIDKQKLRQMLNRLKTIIKSGGKDSVLTLQALPVGRINACSSTDILRILSVSEAEVIEVGNASVMLDLFVQVIAKMRDESLTIAEQGGTLQISHSGGDAVLPVCAADTVPSVLTDSKWQSTAPAAFLALLQKRLVHAADTNRFKPALYGLCFGQEGKAVYACASDCLRLVHATCETASDARFEVIMPREAVPALTYLEDPVTVRSEGVWLSFEHPGGLINTRLIDERFPSFEPVIEQPDDAPIRIETELLRLAAERAVLLSGTHGLVVLTFYPEHLELAASSRMQPLGMKESIRYESGAPGEGFGMAPVRRLLARHLAKELDLVHSKTIELWMDEGKNSIMLVENEIRAVLLGQAETAG